MSSMPREKFATQMRPDLAEALRGLAQSEGRHIQSLLEEAVADLLDKRRRERPRAHVMAAYEASLAPFGSLYEKLAK